MPTATLTKRAFNGGEWNHAVWNRTDLQQYQTALKTCINWIPLPQGAVVTRPGLQFISEVKTSANKTRLMPFIFSVTQPYILEFGNLYVRFYMNGGQIQNAGVAVEIVTPYVTADLPLLKTEQSADTLFIYHPSYPPAKITRTSHTTWFYTVLVYGNSQPTPTGLTATAGTAKQYVVTAVSSTGSESVASNQVASDNSNTLNWTASAGASYYKVYQAINGAFGFIGRAASNTFNIPATTSPDYTISPPVTGTQFNAANAYPGVAAFHDQRVIHGRTNNQPQTLFGTVVGDFVNLNASSPTQDNDAFTFTINSRQVNEIRWIVSLDKCLIFTSGNEYRMQPGSQTATITPTSVDIKVQSSWGCANLPPIVIANGVVFVEASGKTVRNLQYSIQVDKYDSNDLSILASHLFETYGLTEWAYQQFPYSVIWGVRSDGTLLGFSYYPEHQVKGWHRHTTTNGSFESVAVIPSSDGTKEVWFIVNRTIQGVTRRYIERMAPRTWTKIQNAFCVDCGLSYSGTPITTFGNLSQLEGQAVVALADGNVVTGLTVSGGQVTLPNAASTVSIGLPYNCDLETLDYDQDLQMEGPISAANRRIVSATITLKDSRELFIGPDANNLSEIKVRSTENYGVAVALFTGDKANIGVRPPSAATRTSSLFCRVSDPVPSTIQALTAHMSYGER